MQRIEMNSETGEKMVDTLRKGKVAVCPTDTVYGLLADATNAEAVQRVFEIKHRKKEKPVYVFVRDIEMAKEYAEVSEKQEEYMKEVWPGQVTVVLKSKGKLPAGIEQDGKVGMRIPGYPLVQQILEKFGKPVTGTSANIAGQFSCSDSEEVIAQFAGKEHQPDLLVDAGKLPDAKPSTVVDISEDVQRVLRP